MQQDFHFNVIYVLGRCAGFSPVDSQTIANSSQYTDDCMLVAQLTRPDGSRYVPVQTQCPAQMAFAQQWEEGILLPFHFLCNNRNDPTTEPGNPRAKNLLGTAIGLLATNSEFGRHALGIALHAFADTFAHQGFCAFRSDINAVDDLALVPRDDQRLEEITGRFLHVFPKLPPKIGHAQAVYCPDIPFLKWRYKTSRRALWAATSDGVSLANGWVERDNAVIAADAAGQIAGSLAAAQGVAVKVSVAKQVDFFSANRFRSLDSLGQRETQWRELFLNDNFFAGFRTDEDHTYCRYTGKDWLGKAYGFVFPTGGGPAHPGLKNGYDSSDWWNFQQAAKWVKASL